MMQDALDLAGVGIGPSNLSLAALLSGIPELRAEFFERRASFSWHPGLMFPSARMQTSFLKDLVTAVEPRSEHSFLHYLVRHGRFYPFLARERSCVGRHEFADYLGWVAGRLKSLRFGADIQEVRFGDRGFELRDAGGRVHRARHVCVGTGRVAEVPACARPHLGPRCFHAIDILERSFDVSGQRVAVVGGGQTGAEVVLELLGGRWGAPERLRWVSRRLNFEPLDDSPFTNHLFTPDYVRVFHGLKSRSRAELLERHRLAGDGISPETLEALHDVAYDMLVSGRGDVLDLRPGRELVELEPSFRLGLHRRLDDEHEQIDADVVILCTGLDDRIPACLEALSGRLRRDGTHLAVGPDFTVDWDGPDEHRVYVVNAGRHALGIADSQLSLVAWRSAVIINHLLGRPHFDTEGANLVHWSEVTEPPAARPRLLGGGHG